ncbi:unnamed protein product [Angiostrongylus costaricensis]|uniref:Uncharacterized protein n=1 Tax=Angiostrongylus costaricensis TaxID=334426 RepID=A0A0R3PQN7_ANGCS|nr:unnamed protein product [Angiostrongylus costaricensis]
MERLLNEKRVKKLREQEEARIRELEAQKAEIERQLAEEDAKRKKTSLAMVDKLINSRIGALLGQVNTETSEVKSKLPARLSDDEADKDRDEMRRKLGHGVETEIDGGDGGPATRVVATGTHENVRKNGGDE